MYDINTMPGYIPIGNQRDFGHAIQFDLTAWDDLNADNWKITYTRPGESATYPVPDGDVSVADNVLTWTISEAVTAINGAGSVVIEAYRGGEMLKHSDRIMTIIGEGHEPAGEAPDPVADWITDATQKLAEVDHFVDDAIAATEEATAAAGLTTDAIARANGISETLEGIAPLWADVDISASGLAAGAAPTASIAQDETGTSIALGIPKGDTGDTGPQGPKGDTGDTGPSAYDAAVAGGYQGTEAEFNAANAGIEAAKDAALDAAETANEAAENAETAAYRSMLWRKTAPGNPLSVYPVPESPLYPKVSGTFTQEGTGDPSPENIRPITPWLASGEQVKVKRTGKNLLSSVLESGSLTSIGGNSVNASSVRTANFVPILPNTAYVASVDGLTDGVFNRNALYDSNFTFIQVVGHTFTSPANAYYYKLAVANTTDLNAPVQLELGSIPTPYEPYSGTEITLTAPQEIASGWMDNEGRGEISAWDRYVFTGTENNLICETQYGSGEKEAARISWNGYISLGIIDVIQCSHFPSGSLASWHEGLFVYSSATAPRCYFSIPVGVIGWDRIMSKEEYLTVFKNYLVQQYNDGTPVTIFFRTPNKVPLAIPPAPLLALPQADRITPRQNVLTASTGNVELTYAKSPIRESDDIATAIAAL